MAKICLNCGKEFEVTKYGSKKKYCSVACGTEYRNKHPMTDEEKLRNGWIKKECDTCGTPFIARYETTTTCKDCMKKKSNQYRYRHKKTKMKKAAVPISEFEDEAREKGLSYGELQGLKRMRGECV